MLARFAMVIALLHAASAFGQELKGKEASEFLAMASAKIKANCDAIKSWKGKIEAQHDKVHIGATFAIATNGDVFVHVHEQSGHKVTVKGVSRVVERGEPNPPQYKYFVHGDVVDRVFCPPGPAPLGSTLPYRIATQIPKAKFNESIHTKFLNPQQLFEDGGKRRFDQFFETKSKHATREESTTVVTRPADREKTWTISGTFRSRPDAPDSAPKLLSIWKLDESKCFLPISHAQTLGTEEPSTTTYEYEQIKEIYLPKKVIFSSKDDRTQFDLLTESVNEGPEEIEGLSVE